MPDSGILGLEFENYILIFEISTLKFVYLQNFVKKMKMSKFGTKNVLFGYFWARTLKNYCHIWNKHPRICHECVFNWYSSKFWYEVRFF